MNPLTRTLTALVANSGKTTEDIAQAAGVNFVDAYRTLQGSPVNDEVTAAVAEALGMQPRTLDRIISEAA